MDMDTEQMDRAGATQWPTKQHLAVSTEITFITVLLFQLIFDACSQASQCSCLPKERCLGEMGKYSIALNTRKTEHARPSSFIYLFRVNKFWKRANRVSFEYSIRNSKWQIAWVFLCKSSEVCSLLGNSVCPARLALNRLILFYFTFSHFPPGKGHLWVSALPSSVLKVISGIHKH